MKKIIICIYACFYILCLPSYGGPDCFGFIYTLAELGCDDLATRLNMVQPLFQNLIVDSVDHQNIPPSISPNLIVDSVDHQNIPPSISPHLIVVSDEYQSAQPPHQNTCNQLHKECQEKYQEECQDPDEIEKILKSPNNIIGKINITDYEKSIYDKLDKELDKEVPNFDEIEKLLNQSEKSITIRRIIMQACINKMLKF